MNIMTAHREWATRPSDQRFQSLDSLAEYVANRRDRSRESTEFLSDLHAEVVDGELRIKNGKSMTPTHWSFGQTCGLLQAPSAFLGRLQPETAAACINDRLTHCELRDRMKIMRVAGDDGDVLQAVTSATCGRIWDADVVSGVQKIVARTGGKFRPPVAYADGKWGAPLVPSGLYASDRDVFMFLIDGGDALEVNDRAVFHRGFIAWNSEVGARTFGLMTFLFNAVCGNNIIWGASDVKELRIKHSSGAPGRYLNDAVPSLIEYTKATVDLSAIKRAQNIELVRLPGMGQFEKVDDDWRKAFARSHDFTGFEVREAFESAQREEGQCATLWDLVQGFTASAREVPHVDARLNLEARAGRLLELAA